MRLRRFGSASCLNCCESLLAAGAGRCANVDGWPALANSPPL